MWGLGKQFLLGLTLGAFSFPFDHQTMDELASFCQNLCVQERTNRLHSPLGSKNRRVYPGSEVFDYEVSEYERGGEDFKTDLEVHEWL